VLSPAELFDLEAVTFCADLGTCQSGAGCIGHGIMPVAMATGTAYVIGAVLAQLPVDHYAGSDAEVAFGAWVIYLHRRLNRRLDWTVFPCLHRHRRLGLGIFLDLPRAHRPHTGKDQDSRQYKQYKEKKPPH
jgi:hypothetical protein